jgi:hypothetical protein
MGLPKRREVEPAMRSLRTTETRVLGNLKIFRKGYKYLQVRRRILPIIFCGEKKGLAHVFS